MAAIRLRRHRHGLAAARPGPASSGRLNGVLDEQWSWEPLPVSGSTWREIFRVVGQKPGLSSAIVR